MVEVVLYDRIEKWHDRKKATRFYRGGALESDGAERDRYINLLFDLEAKMPICHDGYSLPYEAVKEKGRYYTTPAPDGGRDYGGEIWFRKI